MTPFALMAFDADDTLWHNERSFVAAQDTLKQLRMRYHRPEWVAERLYRPSCATYRISGTASKALPCR